MRLITRAACKHLAVLGLGLGVVVACLWWIMIRMPLKSFAGPLPALAPAEAAVRDALRRDVTTLAGDIGERNVFKPVQLRAAEAFVTAAFSNAGYQVRRQVYQASMTPCVNLEVELAGGKRKDEVVVVGAHYDSVSGSPGANDNGSGVAALLALARAWAGRQPERTLCWVAFVNEEPPFFQTPEMGSLVYAKACRERGDRIVAMLSLETMGWFSDQPGSQKYPFPLGVFYPSRGNFIGFVGNTKNAPLVRRCVAVFRDRARFPCEGGALPGSLPGIGWSDHWAFWQAGYAAVMVTDTAPFRFPHYHTEQDTPDKVDCERLARVVSGLDLVLQDLTGRGDAR